MQTIGLDGSARTAATVVPLLVLGITLNIVALGVADRVHPMRGKTQLVSVAQANARRVQTVTACVLRRIEGRETRCSAKQWASNRLAERAKCRSAARSGHIAYRFRNGLFFPCSGRSRTIGARETLQAI
jgi:hypothetical protein